MRAWFVRDTAAESTGANSIIAHRGSWDSVRTTVEVLPLIFPKHKQQVPGVSSTGTAVNTGSYSAIPAYQVYDNPMLCYHIKCTRRLGC